MASATPDPRLPSHELIVFDRARYGRNHSLVAAQCDVPYTRNCDIDVHFSLNRATTFTLGKLSTHTRAHMCRRHEAVSSVLLFSDLGLGLAKLVLLPSPLDCRSIV